MVGLITAIASAILVLEGSLTTLSAASNLEVWRERMRQLARVDLSRAAARVIAVYSALTLTAIVCGFWLPTAGALGGISAAAGAALVLARQLRYGDRGSSLGPYSLFALCGVLLAVLRLS